MVDRDCRWLHVVMLLGPVSCMSFAAGMLRDEPMASAQWHLL